MKRALITLLLVTAIWNLSALETQARLGESVKASEKRYGKPVSEGDGYPLVKGASHKVYHFEGWKVSVAFLKDESCCIEYSKLREVDREGTVVIREEEIQTLLDAEAGGGEWTKKKEEATSNPFKSFSRFMENTQKWTNSNGNTAQLKQNKLILRFETPAAKPQNRDAKGMGKF